MPSTPEEAEPVCLCSQGVEAVEANRWFLNPDPLGCPVHRPIKQYCKYHHSGFYGNCSACARYDTIENQDKIVGLLELLVIRFTEVEVYLRAVVHPEVVLKDIEPSTDETEAVF